MIEVVSLSLLLSGGGGGAGGTRHPQSLGNLCAVMKSLEGDGCLVEVFFFSFFF